MHLIEYLRRQCILLGLRGPAQNSLTQKLRVDLIESQFSNAEGINEVNTEILRVQFGNMIKRI